MKNIIICGLLLLFYNVKSQTIIEWTGYDGSWVDKPKLGFNHNSAKNKPNGCGWMDNTVWTDAFVDKVVELKPRLLRYPGGTISQYWDWEEGKIVPDELWDTSISGEAVGTPGGLRNIDFWNSNYGSNGCGNKRNITHTIDEFVYELSLLHSKGIFTKPIVVLNVVSSDLEEQIEFLKTFRSKMISQFGYHFLDGLNVEMGNEIYAGQPNKQGVINNLDFHDSYNSPIEYKLAMDYWITRIKNYTDPVTGEQIFSTYKFGIVAKNLVGGNNGDWFDVIMDVENGGCSATQADALIYHHYRLNDSLQENLERFGTGLLNTDLVENTVFNDTRNDIGYVLNKAYVSHNTSMQNQENINREVWITEYNWLEDPSKYQPNCTDENLSTTWIHGLFQAFTTLQYLCDESVSVLMQHNLTGHPNYENIAFLADDSYELRAIGLVSKMINDAGYDKWRARKLSFDESFTGYPKLFGVELRNENFDDTDIEVLIINTSSEGIYLDYPNIEYLNEFEYHKISLREPTLNCISYINTLEFSCPYPNTSHITSNHLHQVVAEKSNDRLFLQPYSLTRIRNKTPYILTQFESDNWGFNRKQGCVISSGNRISEPLIIQPISGEETITLFPNPFSDKIIIDTEKTIESTINVYSISGEKLFETQIEDNKTIYLEGIKSGIYILEAIVEGKQVKLKVVRN